MNPLHQHKTVKSDGPISFGNVPPGVKKAVGKRRTDVTRCVRVWGSDGAPTYHVEFMGDADGMRIFDKKGNRL